jgi:UDPglucose 6-dehydrogenase
MSSTPDSTGVSVVGLGKLGACIAACFASKGFPVIGVDVSQRTVDLVNQHRAPVFEPQLGELMATAGDRLRATSDYGEAIAASAVTLVVVPTPSDEEGGFSLRYVLEAATQIGRALRSKDGYHLVVLTSTVLPGSTEYGMLPILERESGKRCGEGFGLCYSPEFIALGSVIRDFLNPDFLLVGESDERAGGILAELYGRVCDRAAPVARMNFVNAELAKISVNTYVTMKISFANMMAALCEQLPGGDVDVVTAALGLDSRIGPRYLKGAVGYGGPCFPRDNQALSFLARRLGHRAELAEATDSYNRSLLDRLVEKVRDAAPEGGLAAVLGLSYKPDTNIVEESHGLLLADRLARSGLRVRVHDPVAMDMAQKVLGDRVEYATSIEAAVKGADVIVIANSDKIYGEMDLAALRNRPAVIDAWRLLRKRTDLDASVNYLGLGIGEDNHRLSAVLGTLWGDPASTRS